MVHQTERSPGTAKSDTGSPKSTQGNAGPPGTNQRVEDPAGRSASPDRSASDLAEDAKENIRAGAKEGQQKAAELGEQAKRQVFEATNQAKETTRQYAVQKKQQIAEELGVFSSAIQNAAKTLHDEEHDTVAHYIEAAAEHLDSAREAVQNKPIGEFVEDLQAFTRRHPEIVFGSLFVAGVAAMRFAKASRPVSDQRGGGTRGAQSRNTLPARRADVGPPPGFGPTSDGQPRPANSPGMSYPSTSPSPTQNP